MKLTSCMPVKINDINTGNDPIKKKKITAWNNQEIVKLSTIAWKCGMKISQDYRSIKIKDPTHFSLTTKHFNLNSIFNY